MSVLSIDNFRHESRVVLRIAVRAARKRVAAAGLILGLCWLAGARDWVWVLAALIALSEASGLLAARRARALDGDPPLWLAAWTWLTNVPSTPVFLAPALLLVMQPELPWALAGFLWLFGSYVHISNSFVALPLYNWSQMVPALLMGLVVIGAAAWAHGGDPWPWAAVAGLFAVYAANTVETITTQKEVKAELASARAQARARLQALEHMARHDRLTGLLNRQAFDEGLGALLARRRPGRAVACFLVDLDGFKAVNDGHGHAAGDAVLVVAGRRLQRLAGEAGIAGRLGGDELAVALPDLPSAEAALEAARAIAREVEAPVRHAGKEFRVGGSVGVALAVGSGSDGADAAAVALLCARADQAMFRAKAAARAGGERGPVLFDPARFPPRPSPEDRSRLALALAERRIRPAYLPVVDLDTGALMGFEAVARWGGAGGAPGAGAVLPLAREVGLGGDLMVAMAEQVAADVSALLAEGLDPGRVSFDVPEAALATHGGRADLDGALLAHPAARGRLVLQIGDEALAARAADALGEAVGALRLAGIGVALDGFGAGAGSLRHLRRVGFDEVRLDAALVADLPRDPAAAAVLEGLAAVGRALGTRVVARGVDGEDQRRLLLRLGCREGQGRLFGGAMPFAEARRWLLAGTADPEARQAAG